MRDFDIPFQFHSQYISKIKKIRDLADKRKKDFSPTVLNFDNLSILIPRHFGFCFGVQNAVEKAYEILENNPDKTIYLISEIIHNPDVNRELKERGLQFIQDTKGNQMIDWDTISENDIVIVPAFGTTPEIETILKEKNIAIEKYDTTCPFVERVWNKGEILGKEGYTIIIHGDPYHEETRATMARISQYAPAVIVSNDVDADMLREYILQSGPDERDWNVFFKHQASDGFNFRKHLNRIAVVNQTTMLASQTQVISSFLKDVMIKKCGEKDIDFHFGSTRDTLCYATNDNQTAIEALIQEKPDVAFIVGGHNSSNTSHLVELIESSQTTYFISSEKSLKDESLKTFDIHSKELREVKHYLPENKPLKIAIGSGASCPDATLERVMLKLLAITKQSADIEKTIENVAKHYGL